MNLPRQRAVNNCQQFHLLCLILNSVFFFLLPFFGFYINASGIVLMISLIFSSASSFSKKNK